MRGSTLTVFAKKSHFTTAVEIHAHQLLATRNDWIFRLDGLEHFYMSFTCPQRRKKGLMGDFEMALNHNVLFWCNRCALSTTNASEVRNASFSPRCDDSFQNSHI